jgi:hypothetical protein
MSVRSNQYNTQSFSGSLPAGSIQSYVHESPQTTSMAPSEEGLPSFDNDRASRGAWATHDRRQSQAVVAVYQRGTTGERPIKWMNQSAQPRVEKALEYGTLARHTVSQAFKENSK